MIKVFFCEPTTRVRRNLRVYESGEGVPACPLNPGQHGYHNAHSEQLDELECPLDDQTPVNAETDEFDGDPRWPTHCACGYEFGAGANRSVWHQRMIRRTDTGEMYEGYRNLPPGAVWNATWMVERDGWVGPDGRSLICKLPDGHDWMIDGQANNCTMPDDHKHKCWVRHGRTEDGTLHVDKNGHTCSAGAGSIATPNWHGFLHNGQLVPC